MTNTGNAARPFCLILVLAFLVTALVALAAPVASAAPVVVPAPPAGCVSAYHGLPGEDPTVVACDRYSVDPSDSEETPDLVAACLVGEGWHGLSSVPGETIIAPWPSIESCASRAEFVSGLVAPQS